METSCKFGVPLHNGPHSLGRAFGNYKSSSKVSALESEEKNGDYKKVVKKEMSFMPYTDATKEEMMGIKALVYGGDFCYDDEGNASSEEKMQEDFLNEMMVISDRILQRISDFVWTINRDGRDYKPGNPCGCSGVNTMKQKKKVKVRGTFCKIESHGRSPSNTTTTTLKMGY